MNNQTRNHLNLQKHIADQDHIIRVRNAEIAALRKRAEKAEQERDSWESIAQQTARSIDALRAEQPRTLTADDIEQLVTQNRYRVADAIRALYPEEPMATDVLAHTVITALTEPTRPEGAEEIEAVIRKVVPSHPEDRYGDLADRLAERGVRVTGGN